jgi:hypothetical protein
MCKTQDWTSYQLWVAGLAGDNAVHVVREIFRQTHVWKVVNGFRVIGSF